VLFACEEDGMTEQELIAALAKGFPRAPEQLNALHEADAEILRVGEEVWAVTVDDFSPEEDLFFGAPLDLIGWNVAVATLSDLLCVGAVPRFFLPAVGIPPDFPSSALEKLSAGVREALESAGCFLVGGDVGRADPWRYVGTALGPVEAARPLTRRIPEGRHTLWISGAMGAANMAAASGSPPPRFPLHLEVAQMVRALAVACTDTSGGFCEAVWNLGRASPKARIEVDLDRLPLAEGASDFTAAYRIPPETILLGGAGEYELVFAIPEGSSKGALGALAKAGCTRVGTAARGTRVKPGLGGNQKGSLEAEGEEEWRSSDAASRGEGERDRQTAGILAGETAPGLYFRRGDGEPVQMAEPPPCPRAAGSIAAHIRDVTVMAEALFGRGG
jgi:thiamine monophosphate kinase